MRRTLQSAKERIHCVAIDEAHCIEEWLVFTYNKLHNCVKFLDCVFFPRLVFPAGLEITALAFI